MTKTAGVGLLLLSGCEVARAARDDLQKLASSLSTPSEARRTTPPPQKTTKVRAKPAASSLEPSVAALGAAAEPTNGPSRDISGTSTVELAGVSENRLRTLLGNPTAEKDHPPGKQWQYRDGKCTLDVQLYPDVHTKQFGTLAYKVNSDDNTDEGRRFCLAQLQFRLQTQR